MNSLGKELRKEHNKRKSEKMLKGIDIKKTTITLKSFYKHSDKPKYKFRAFDRGELQYFDLADTVPPFLTNKAEQFSNCVDKAEKRIYAGDYIITPIGLGVVTHNYGHFGVEIEVNNYEYYSDYLYKILDRFNDNVFVIGNIHEGIKR